MDGGEPQRRAGASAKGRRAPGLIGSPPDASRTQHHVEVVGHVRRHMAVVERVPVAGVEGGGRAADQGGVGDHLLKVRRRLVQLVQHWAGAAPVLGAGSDTGMSTGSAAVHQRRLLSDW